MQFHRGRLFDHIHLRVANLEASKRFYRWPTTGTRTFSRLKAARVKPAADTLWVWAF